ncbi:hypothetical protein BX070DRAFT_253493 [Coemansia spiralis]|nr:hypothetical protein BX070DRAFT_253493 [Coemansia spiralis]
MIEVFVCSPSISTPSQFKVYVESGQTVLELKAAIEKEHHASPPARHMRLIWRGRILKDSSLVKELVANEGGSSDILAVHFVLNMPMGLLDEEVSHSKSQNACSSTMQPRTNNNDGLRQRAASSFISTSTTDGVEKSAEQSQNPKEQPASSSLNGSHNSVADSSNSSHTQNACSARQPPLAASAALPLGNPFQYVLVDGMPYLMEMKSSASSRSSEAADVASQGPGRILLKAYADLVTRQSTLEARLRRMAESGSRVAGTEAGSGTERNNADTNGAAQDGNAHNAGGNNVLENGIPLPDALRGFGMDAMWNVMWFLLRMLLLVVVFAHDASLERMLLLVLLIGGVVLFRSPWVQQRLQQLNAGNNYIDERSTTQGARDADGGDARDRQREYSTLEKAKALVVALVTSLIPSEPLQAPMMEE